MRILKVLIYEPNKKYVDSYKKVLDPLGHKLITISHTVEDTKDALTFEPIDLAIIHYDITKDGMELTLGNYIREHHQIPFIYTVESQDETLLKKAEKTLKDGFVQKPINVKNMQMKITSLMFEKQNEETDSEITEEEESVEVSDNLLEDSIFIKKEGNYLRVYFKDIQYIQSDNVYLEVYTSMGKFLVRSTLKEYLKKLPDNLFYRAHKSYIVNINYIETINKADILICGKKIPISKSFRIFITNSINL